MRPSTYNELKARFIDLKPQFHFDYNRDLATPEQSKFEYDYQLAETEKEKLLLINRFIVAYSTDLSRKFGCFAVRDNKIISIGYNTFPDGCKLTDERLQRPNKYLWTGHAEERCVCAAAKHGVSLYEATLYLNGFPCCACMRIIIQSGIKQLNCIEPDLNDATFGHEYQTGLEMANESELVLKFVFSKENYPMPIMP